jgi:hypothetical protein
VVPATELASSGSGRRGAQAAPTIAAMHAMNAVRLTEPTPFKLPRERQPAHRKR